VVVAVRRGRLLAVAAAVLGVGALLAPATAPPLYDGVNYPDEPYRFVTPPKGAPTTKPPTSATATATVTGGRAGQITLATKENAPQLSIDLPAGAAIVPSGTAGLTLTAQPIADIPVPQGKYLWSDVYDVRATQGSVTRITDASGQPTITLRAVNAQRPEPVIARYDGTAWSMLPTLPVGNDIYSAQFPGLGKYAVLGSKPLVLSSSTSNQGVSGNVGIWIALGAVAVVIVLIAVSVRRRLQGRRAGVDADVPVEDTEEP
jgi:hypothetical protein